MDNKRGFVPVVAIFAVAVVLIGGGVLLWAKNHIPTIPNTPIPISTSTTLTTQTQPSIVTTSSVAKTIASSTPIVINTSNWKTFTSPMEYFQLKYPADWTIEDTTDGNCGFHTGGSSCRDRYDFISPDGVRVRYINNDQDSDRASCGTQAPCLPQTVLGLEKINIQNLGKIYLVKLSNEVFLHDPIDSQTIPVLGQNQHADFSINFSLPSQGVGRYALFITTFSGKSVPPQPPQLTNMGSDQFYNLKSVQEGIMILKSLSYSGYPTIAACTQITGELCVRNTGEEIVPSDPVARNKLIQCEKILPSGYFPVSLIDKYNTCMGSSTGTY